MTSPATPRSLLEEALAQRSRCHLTLPKIIGGLKELDCDIVEASDRGLLLECLDKAAPGPHWTGLPVTGFFRVMQRREALLEEQFYTFETRIQTGTAGSGGLLRVRLNEPATLVFGQRRKSLRLEPELDRLRSVFLWRYDRETGFNRDTPALRSSDFQNGLVRLVNLSAGGLCLSLRAALARERALPTTRGDRLVLHLELREPRASTATDFLLVAKVSHFALDRVSQNLSLGLEFLAEGVIDPKTGKMRWLPVANNAIARLVDILYLWHLDRHRERLA
ncbi:PilZ domain-containing protein [Desulfovibrio aerotolerans]|uniref:PilZ domain-containing protein n=2 Tax=Solidesulfovibrio aerotolerans TaxID=295255 RepID=A0A7C9MMD0_9BACT|nr:PilZ domain-containing protein [Solidesulfovibrio aerotolerans]